MNTSTLRELLIPDFLNIDFVGNRKNMDIRQFVLKVYDAKRIEVLVSLFRHLDSNFNYVVEHHYTFFYHERFNPNIDFLTSYNSKTKKREFDYEVMEHHLSIDCNLLSRYGHDIVAIQTELKTVLQGIESAIELNNKIAKIFEGESTLDVQKIWRYYNNLYLDCLSKLLQEDTTAAMETIDLRDIPEYTEEPLDEKELNNGTNDEFNRKLLSCIRQRQKQDGRNDIPTFNLKKYRELESYNNSPLINSNEGNLIARFAGKSTPLLEKRLKEVNFKIGAPIQNPVTKSWNYTIDYSSNFLGFIYREFLEYVNSMIFDGLGFIPRCDWCQNPIQPTSQQIRRLKEKKHIYCIESYKNCKRNGIKNNQNKTRSKQKNM
ncbi:hypothetical protein ACIQWQ_26055 [Peribacillus frigoritolerans]